MMPIASSVTGNQATVIAEIARLIAEEAAVSEQRHRLHLRLERLHLETPRSQDDEVLVQELTEAELWISRSRADLHRRINELRAEVGLPPVFAVSSSAAA
jgi:hypothetical protein